MAGGHIYPRLFPFRNDAKCKKSSSVGKIFQPAWFGGLQLFLDILRLFRRTCFGGCLDVFCRLLAGATPRSLCRVPKGSKRSHLDRPGPEEGLLVSLTQGSNHILDA